MPRSFREQETHGDLAGRIIALTGEITNDSATVAIAKLLFLADQSAREPITVLVNSPGGNVVAALAIINTFRDIAPPVRTLNTGFAGGVAALLVAAGEKSHRGAYAHATFALSPVQMTDGSTPPGVERMQLELNQLFAQLTLQPHLSADLAVQFSAETAKEIGVVDIIEPTPN